MTTAELASFIVKHEHITVIEVVCPMERGHEAMTMLHATGWSITRCGPYSDRDTFPDVDIERAQLVAEKRTR